MQQPAFSIIEAAAAGLHLVRRRPLALVGASLLYLAGSLGGFFLSIGPGAGAYAQLSETVSKGGEPTPQTLVKAVEAMAQIGLLTLPATLLMMVFACALTFRALNRPEDSRFFYLGLGPDELRQGVVRLLVTAVVFVGGGAVSIIVTAATALTPAAGQGLVGFLGGCALFGVVGQLWLRLSLAPAATFAEGAVRLSASWRMTAGHAWRMLAAYVLPAAAVFGAGQLWTLVVGGLTGGVMAQMNTDMSAGGFDIAAFFAEHTVAVLMVHVLTAPMGGLQLLLTLAPGAVIYRALTGRG